MSEVSDGSGPIQRRPQRANEGGAPVSGALAIVLAVIAVVAGFLILRSISDNGEKQLDVQSAGSGSDSAGDGDTAPQSTTPSSTLPSAPATTEPPLVTEGATVVVANANGIPGSAAAMRNALEAGPNFTMGDSVDASDATGVLPTSVIYYDPANVAAQPVADSVARALGGGVTVLPLPGTPPTQSGTLEGDVLLMLGTDKANKTLEELNPGDSTTVITNPSLTGSTAAP